MKFFFTVGAFVAIVFAAGIGGSIMYNTTNETKTCTVSEKDRGVGADGSSAYRVYTDCGVFAVEDNLAYGKFNSADTYAQITVGKKYELELVGFRNGILSMFPNILEATPVS